MRKFSILSMISMFLLAVNVSAADIYVNQATGNNATGVKGDPESPYKDLSYVLYKTSITGGPDPAKTHLAGQSFGAVVADGDNIYIDGLYDLTQDPAYVPVSVGGAANHGFWGLGDFVVSGNHTYNIVGKDESSMITCASEAEIAADPNLYGGSGNAFRFDGGAGFVFKNLTFRNMGIVAGSATGDNERGIIWAQHISKNFGFENCIFTKNASKSGWLINTNNVMLTMTNCTIEDNYARKGLVLVDGGGNFSTELTLRYHRITGCTIRNNGTAPGIGSSVINTGDDYAAIVLRQCYDAQVINTTIKNNISYGGGGAILIKDANRLILVDECIIDGNQSSKNNAPAFFIKNAKPTEGITIRNTDITNNAAMDNGGGISIRDSNQGTFLFENCLIKGNDVSGGSWKIGGGLLFQKGIGDYTFKNCRFEGNKASKGGAMAFDCNVGDSWTANLNFENCSFVGNIASESGGAFYYTNDNVAFTSNLTFANSTFYGNNITGGAGDNSGGSAGYFHKAVNSGAIFKMMNCTLSGNTSAFSGRGGIRVRNDARVMQKQIHNCIMEGNAGNDISYESAGTNTIDLRNSYVSVCENYTSSDATNTVGYTETNLPVGAAYYVNITGALPLLATSPALTAGDPALLAGFTTDQLGVTRGQDAIAVGAVEKPAIIITSASETTVEQGGSFTVTAEGVLDAFSANAIAYSLNGSGPADVNISATGEISVGTGVAAGSYSFNVVATDAAETAYTQPFELTVTESGTGLDKVVAGKAIQSVSYYDLTGKSVPAGTKGFVVKKTVYEDGSIGNSKAMVK